MKLFVGILILMLAGLIFFNCDLPAENPEPDYSLVSLEKADSCKAVENQLKANMIKYMEQRIDESLETTLEHYHNGCATNTPTGCDAAGGGAPPPSASSSSSSSSSSSGAGGSDSPGNYSETNVQVPGVDEADFVKNDGANIYILADNQFKIIDAWPAASATVLSSTAIEGAASKLYVYNNKALIYSILSNSASGANDYPRQECTYGYDCEFTGSGGRLKITVLDISDTAAPKLEREIAFNGAYLNSRRIGSNVHTAVIFPEFFVHGLAYRPADIPHCLYHENTEMTEAEIVAAFAELKAHNIALINAADVSGSMPTIEDTRYVDGAPVVSDDAFGDCSGIYLSQSPEGRSLLSLVSLTIDALEPLSATAIAGKPGAIYASKDSLYVAARQYKISAGDWYFEASDRISEATTVHKFKLADDVTGVQYVASGVVKGRVLNQFSMDEYDGYLRMATTWATCPMQAPTARC